MSTLQISYGRSPEKRTVKQYRFTDWPEHGLPPSTSSLVEVVRRVDEDASAHAPAPLLVHCANGMGKTGAVMAVHFSLKQFSADGTVDLPKVVNNLRRQRGALLQSKDQYQFCCQAVADALDSRETKEEEFTEGPETRGTGKKKDSKTSAVPLHLKSTVRPFSAPVDAGSLTPTTQRKLYLQNMLPPPPPYPPSQTSLLSTSTPPPPFTSPKGKSTPFKSSAPSPSSDSSFDSIVKTRDMSDSSLKNIASATSLDSVPKKGRSGGAEVDQPESILEDSLSDVQPRLGASEVRVHKEEEMSTTVEEEVSTTIIQVEYHDSTLEGPPSEEESVHEASHTPAAAVIQPRKGRSPPMKKKTSIVKAPEEKAFVQPQKDTAPERKGLGSKPPSATVIGDSPPQAEPLTVTVDVEVSHMEEGIKPPSSKDGNQHSGGHTVETKKENVEEEEEVVGFVISDEPLLAPSKPVVSSVTSKPPAKRTWKPPAKDAFPVMEKKPTPTRTFPKADVPREEKRVQPETVSVWQRASSDVQHEEFDIKSRPIGKLDLGKFQMFDSPKVLRAHKGGPAHVTTPPKKPEPEQPAPPTPPSHSSPEPVPTEQAVAQPSTISPERVSPVKLNLTQWESPAAATTSIPPWKQKLLQKRAEQKAKEEAHSAPPPTAVEAPVPEQKAGETQSVKKLDMSRFAVFGSPK